VEVATGSLDGIARIWDAAAGRPGLTLSGHSSWIHALAYAPSGTMIATGSGDNTARTWDAATGAARATLRGHSGQVKAVSFAPDGSLLAMASSDATARLWEIASGAHLATLVPLPSGGHITLLPDARYKLDGDPGDCLWWAAGLRRLGLAEVSRRFPEIRRLPRDAPILPA
jgi:WD40 repeat protein